MDYILERIPCYLPDDECWEYQGYINPQGYGLANLRWKQNGVYAHRAMFEAFYETQLQPKEVVRHKCDNPACCNPHHLERGLQADNVRDCVERGRFPSRAGEANGRAKLSKQLVEDIRKIYSSGMWSYGLLAQLFEIPKPTIAHIITGYTWPACTHEETRTQVTTN